MKVKGIVECIVECPKVLLYLINGLQVVQLLSGKLVIQELLVQDSLLLLCCVLEQDTLSSA